MNAAVPDCLVQDFEPVMGELKLPDPDDRHVLAAAINVGAQVIVTDNVAATSTPAWSTRVPADRRRAA